MPNRIVREGINSSPRVNVLSPAAEIFYRRLLNVVDDYGRFHGSPGTLRGACWPTCPDRFSDDEVSDFLLECLKPDSKDRRLIWLYESDGCMFLQVVDFRQQCRSKSKFPEPDINCLANAEQLLRTRRSRISYSKAESLLPSAGSAPASQALAAGSITAQEWPKTAEAVKALDPGANGVLLERLVRTTIQAALSDGKVDMQLVNDCSIAAAVVESVRTGPKRHGAGLLLNRVPEIIITWGHDG